MSIYLLTGEQPDAHIDSWEDAACNIGTLGPGEYVLNIAEKLQAEVITANKVHVYSGHALMQGRHWYVDGEGVECLIENGASGVKRNDLIVARYEADVSGMKGISLRTIKGTPTAQTPEDPTYVTADLYANPEAPVNEMPLYRIPIDGLVVGTPVKLFKQASSSGIIADNVDFDGKVFTTTEKSKLSGIASGAQVNPGNATGSAPGLMSNTDKSKLDNIASGAQVNPANVITNGLTGATNRDAALNNFFNYPSTLNATQVAIGVKRGSSWTADTLWGSNKRSTLQLGGGTQVIIAQPVYDDSDSAAANVVVATDGTLRRSTSSKRYKTNIESQVIDPDLMLKLNPRSWIDKEKAKKANKEGTRLDDLSRHTGLIAEELDELPDGNLFVIYDEKGRPDAIAYQNMIVAAASTLQMQEKRIQELEERVLKLDQLL